MKTLYGSCLSESSHHSNISHVLWPRALLLFTSLMRHKPPATFPLTTSKKRYPPLSRDHNDLPLRHSSGRSGRLSSGPRSTLKPSSRPPASRRERKRVRESAPAPLHSRIRASCSCHLHGWRPFPTDSANKRKNKNLLMLAFSSPSNSTIARQQPPPISISSTFYHITCMRLSLLSMHGHQA